MGSLLDKVCEEYNRSDQQIKRDIAEYLHNRPGQWVAKQELVAEFDIDESGVGRHLDDLHDSEALQSKKNHGKRYVKWIGRGAGGLRYWLRVAVPDEFWVVGEQLRAFLRPGRLGGASILTILFAVLMCFGVGTALLTIVLTYVPGNSLFGVTLLQTFAITGLATVIASLLLALVPVARVVETVLWALLPTAQPSAQEDDSDG